jgi:predicted N-acyltransferase
LLARHRRTYGHCDDDDAFRDRLARIRQYGDQVRVLVAERAGRAIGFTVVILDPTHARLVPRMFACEDNHAFVYFNLAFYEPVHAAAGWGLSTLALGATAYRAKLLRGAHLAPCANWLLPLRDDLRTPLAAAVAYRNELEAARRAALAALES